MQPKVSICIPAFNQTEFLARNLDSLAAQDLKDFEVVISDDSSDDRVKQLVEEFFRKHPLRYIYHRNTKALGSPANWNKALSLASGEYIKIMHHDDWFTEASSLSTFVRAMDMNPHTDFVFCTSAILDVATGKVSENKPDKLFLDTLGKDPVALFNNNRIGAPSATLFRRDEKMRFDEKLKYLVDVEFYIRLLKRNPHFIWLGEPLITNTSNHAGQVTAASINKITQVGEYCYLYNKLFKGAFPAKKYRVFFRDLFAWYKLKSFEEIEAHGFERPRPAMAFNFLLWQSKFKTVS